ncbi:MAG: glycosyltransferase family 39 protein [Candidatus Thermoplasmatota archaeon]
MAVRTSTSTENGDRRAWIVALSLLVLFAAALFLRAYWNMDAAVQDGHFVLSSGSDPYYEKRAIDAIQDKDFRTLIQDPLLNYPYGAVNPNPPLYQWSVAIAGHFIAPLFSAHPEMGLSQEQYATWWATEWAPAVFGALTIFPMYFIGKALFDRRIGLLTALFWTISTEAIDVTGLGDSRHYAAALFFTTLAFLFYIKTVENFRGHGNWITSWRDSSAISSGLGNMFRERRMGFGYSFLTAMSIGAVALMWKGFPYIIGIIGAYAALQLVIDHWKNRDSTGLFVATTIAILFGTIMAYPYYAAANVANFLTPVWFMVVAFVVGGLVLVPTRDLPTILVMPAALLVGILGIAAAFFVLPDVAHSLLYTTVYFKQTALYETIAEAHPSDFSQIAFSIGPIPFLFALAGWVMLLFTQRKHPQRAVLFALVWGIVALYMAHAALRFIINAIPVFAVFGAYATIQLIDWLDFGTIKKSIAANRGSFWTGLRKGIRPLQVVITILLVLLLVIPNTLLAADAALPPEKEQNIRDSTNSEFLKSFMDKEFGAYGQGFLPDYWLKGLTWLDAYDKNITNHADRPAFLSWWDYGHWAIAVGNHPTVADNFQNGYQFAAEFILSQNETSAVQLLSARTLPILGRDAGAKLIEQAGVTEGQGGAVYDELVAWQYATELSLEQSVKLEKLVTEATKDATHPSGVRIRYFTTDVRMLPYDNPQTPNIEQSSIYYAPVKLAGQNPDDYVPVMIALAGAQSGQFVTQQQFEDFARNPVSPVEAQSEKLQFTQKFYDSMFYRAYVGTPVQGPFPTDGDQEIQALNNPHPAYGMSHFRLIYASPELKIVEYYPGATVSGTVTQDGVPIEGVTLVVFDDAGKLLVETFPEQFRAQVSTEEFDVPHSMATTDAAGKFTLVSPFAIEGGNVTIVASKDGVTLTRQHLAITREDAETGKEFPLAIALEKGTVEGVLFEDKDGNGAYNTTNDTPLSDEFVTIGGQTGMTAADGSFKITNVPVGQQNVTTNSTGYVVSPTTNKVSVRPGETIKHDVALDLKPATVKGLLYADADGNGQPSPNEQLGFQTLSFAPDANVTANGAKLDQAFTDSSGNYTTALAPGSYVVTASYAAPDGTAYKLETKLVVATGESRVVDYGLTKA